MEDEIQARLAAIDRVFDTQAVLARNSTDPAEIARYYRKNRLAYRLFNSHEGFVHMGISEDGILKAADFYKQASLVDEAIASSDAKAVLELAPGKGATIQYLAGKHPDVSFYGIDLARGQLADKELASNVTLSFGDYHDLRGYADASMDLVYVIEALCHAADKRQVIEEVGRVLRPGGAFIVIDGYYSKERRRYTPLEQKICDLSAASMMVTTKDQTYDYLLKTLAAADFTVSDRKDYSRQIMPSLLRLEDKAKRLLGHPRLASLITRIWGEIVTANAIAGYLMPLCVQAGLFEYRYTLAVKKEPRPA